MPPGGAYKASLNGRAPGLAKASGHGGPGGAFHASQSKPAAPVEKTHRGVLGEIGHVAGQTASDLEHAAINAPAGGYKVVKDAVAPGTHPSWSNVGQQWKDLILHGKLDTNNDPLARDVKGMAASVKESVQHPLRHPGLTLLNLLPVVSGVSKAAIVGAEGARGLEAGSLSARTLRKGDLTVHPETSRSGIGIMATKGTDKLLQHAADKKPGGVADSLLNRKIGKVITAEAKQATRNAKGPAARLIAIGRKLSPAEQKALQVVAEEAPLHERITAASARVTGARDATARARHQEELTLLHDAKKHLADGSGKPTFAEGDLKLPRVYKLMQKVAGDRETLLKNLGLLSDEAVHSRTTAAGRVAVGQSLHPPERFSAEYRGQHTAPGPEDGAPIHDLTKVFPDDVYDPATQVRYYGHGGPDSRLDKATFGLLNKLRGNPDAEVTVYRGVPKDVGAIEPGDWVTPNKAYAAQHAAGEKGWHVISQKVPAREVYTDGNSIHEFGWNPAPQPRGFEASPQALRIPDVATKRGAKALSRMGSVGAQGTVGHLKAPGSTTHEYGGVLREHALRRQDTAQLLGESGLEAAKYAGLKHIHDLVRKAASATPTRADDIAVRLDKLKSHETMPLNVRKFLADPEEFFKSATPHEQASMLDKARQQLFIQPHLLDATAKAQFEKLNAAGKIGWVPKKMLGELANPSAPLRAVAPGKTVGTVDAINNASRFAILYLKPAYAIPNVLGNAALGIVQQGWAAPRNLAQAAKLIQRLDDEDYARIDSSVGEGVARAVSAHGAGRLSHIVDFAAGKWSNVVDTPFRRAAFIHEARRSGFKTPEQIHDLLARDAHDPELIRIGIRSNRDAIDYENLGPTEREIIRRLVFFFPWVRGSTVYAGRFVKEHPVQAAVVGQLGRMGQQYSDQGLGAKPSYYEGLIPFGKDRAFNPASAAILQTPAQVGEAAQGLLSGNIPSAAQLTNFATPSVALALAEIERKNGIGIPYKPGHRNFGQVAADTLGGGLPQVTLYKALRAALADKGQDKVYPPSVAGALGQFMLGGLYPRKINRATLNQQAASEQDRIRTGR